MSTDSRDASLGGENTLAEGHPDAKIGGPERGLPRPETPSAYDPKSSPSVSGGPVKPSQGAVRFRPAEGEPSPARDSERELVEAARAFLACGPDYGGQFRDDFSAYMEKFDIAYARVKEAVEAYGDV